MLREVREDGTQNGRHLEFEVGFGAPMAAWVIYLRKVMLGMHGNPFGAQTAKWSQPNFNQLQRLLPPGP